jgi:hypothetical protein
MTMAIRKKYEVEEFPNYLSGLGGGKSKTANVEYTDI